MDLSGVLSEALTGAVKDHEPRIFTQASYEQRKLDLMEAHDKGEKEFRRLKLVIDWKVLHVVFKGREENPIDTAEYVAYRDLKLAELPPEAGDPQFTHEGYRVVSKINWDLKDELHKAFAGFYNQGKKPGFRSDGNSYHHDRAFSCKGWRSALCLQALQGECGGAGQAAGQEALFLL